MKIKIGPECKYAYRLYSVAGFFGGVFFVTGIVLFIAVVTGILRENIFMFAACGGFIYYGIKTFYGPLKEELLGLNIVRKMSTQSLDDMTGTLSDQIKKECQKKSKKQP
jgi:hypothetical protein